MVTTLMVVWFAAAIIGHDLVLFPLYAAVDRLLVRIGSAARAVNYLRVPLAGAGLTFLLFLPGIIRQGRPTFQAATGLDQQPYLARWLLLCAVLFAGSIGVYLVRRTRSAGGRPTPADQPAGARDDQDADGQPTRRISR
jgi:hypothetical protein